MICIKRCPFFFTWLRHCCIFIYTNALNQFSRSFFRPTVIKPNRILPYYSCLRYLPIIRRISFYIVFYITVFHTRNFQIINYMTISLIRIIKGIRLKDRRRIIDCQPSESSIFHSIMPCRGTSTRKR